MHLSETIFKPPRMTNTLYPVSNDLPGNLHGYSMNLDTGRFAGKTILNPTPAGGARAIISTIVDLATYARALYTGSLLQPQRPRRGLQPRLSRECPILWGMERGSDNLAGSAVTTAPFSVSAVRCGIYQKKMRSS